MGFGITFAPLVPPTVLWGAVAVAVVLTGLLLAVRTRGWIVPAYPFVKDRDDLHVLRIVVRNGFGMDLADLFLGDMERLLSKLEKLDHPMADEDPSFHH